MDKNDYSLKEAKMQVNKLDVLQCEALEIFPFKIFTKISMISQSQYKLIYLAIKIHKAPCVQVCTFPDQLVLDEDVFLAQVRHEMQNIQNM